MDEQTISVYDARGPEWAARRRPVRQPAARRFAARLGDGGLRADLGCGAGRYTPDLGRPVVGVDASLTMLRLARSAAPGALLVAGDLEALPFRDRCLEGGWANMSYLHVPRPRLPLALARLHWAMQPGARLDMQVRHGDEDLAPIPDDDVPGRRFSAWQPAALADVLTGAGFEVDQIEVERDVVRATAVRMRSLPDVVGPGMRVLVCGLNPSIYSADRGVGFARRANRFWTAAVAAGLVTRPFDPLRALLDHGVGMTDLVKRATVGSRELTRDEYRAGFARVEHLAAWLRPGVVCFVGLEGWRVAVDRRAVAGLQETTVGGVPAYVMPSTSGLNASTQLPGHIAHLRQAAAIADRA